MIEQEASAASSKYVDSEDAEFEAKTADVFTGHGTSLNPNSGGRGLVTTTNYSKKVVIDVAIFLYFIGTTTADAIVNIPREGIIRYPFFLTRENLFLSAGVSSYIVVNNYIKKCFQREDDFMDAATRAALTAATTIGLLWAGVLLPTDGFPENKGDQTLSILIHVIPLLLWIGGSKMKQEKIASLPEGGWITKCCAELKSFAPTFGFVAWSAFLLGIYTLIDRDKPIYDILDWDSNPVLAAGLTTGACGLAFAVHVATRPIINNNISSCIKSSFYSCLERCGIFSGDDNNAMIGNRSQAQEPMLISVEDDDSSSFVDSNRPSINSTVAATKS